VSPSDRQLSALEAHAVHLPDTFPTTEPIPQSEHRPVTILCCALVDAAALANRVGLDALHHLQQQWLTLAQGEVQRYEGTMQHVVGESFLAFFGAPVAQEDHARRAVLAALGLQRRLREHRFDLVDIGVTSAVSPQVRMGLHTGLVVIGSSGDTLRTLTAVIGEATHLATELQRLAPPGTILLSEAVMRLVEGEVRVEPLGSVSVPGASQQVMTYKVLGRSPRPLAIVGRGERYLSQFVGRTQELLALRALLARVENGQGQAVGIVGEVGIGKSRLLYEFQHSLRGARVTYLEGRCVSYGHAMPYVPVRDTLQHACGITDADSPETIATKVQQSLQALGMAPEEHAPYLLWLLELPTGTDRLTLLTPEAVQARTFATLRRMCLHGSQQQPLIIAVEDVSWIDSPSEAFFASLVESFAAAPILFLATYRPGYHPPWADKSYATQIALPRLDARDSLAIVHSVRSPEQLPPPLTQKILTQAEGNPFFLEELTRAVAEHDDLRAGVTVPDTIQGVLMARIDRLPMVAKHLLQTASVLGREFSLRLLTAVWEGPQNLELHLKELQRQEFLYEKGSTEDPVYVFKHPLTQEVAYESLLWSRRQTLHAAAGRTLEALYPDRLVEVCDRLAYHYARTEDADKAVTYLTLFAEKAARGHAHIEAVKALQEALQHAEKLPTAERDRRFLETGAHLVQSLHFLNRFQESLEFLSQQQERLERLQDVWLAGVYHLSLGFTYSMIGDHERAAQSAQRARVAATRSGDVATMGRAHYILALEGYWSGQPLQGIAHGREAVVLLQRAGKRWSLGMAYFLLGVNYILKGEFALALEVAAEVRTIADTIEDLSLQSYVAWMSGWIYAMQGEWEKGIAACQQGLACSPSPLNAIFAQTALGIAYVEKGDPVQAIPLLQRSAAQAGQFRQRPLQGWAITLLAESHLLTQDLEQAQVLALQGLEIARVIKNVWGMGIAQHILGRIALARGALAEAETHLTATLQIFTTMQAGFQAGRVQLDLATLAHAQGHQETVVTHLKAAQALFRTLRVPKYVERTAQLASALGVSLPTRQGPRRPA
jgi:class 3 adenylate cyclase/tetratricopeptide (TPR) repeat protein